MSAGLWCRKQNLFGSRTKQKTASKNKEETLFGAGYLQWDALGISRFCFEKTLLRGVAQKEKKLERCSAKTLNPKKARTVRRSAAEFEKVSLGVQRGCGCLLESGVFVGESAKTLNPKKRRIIGGVRWSEAKCGEVRRGFLESVKRLRVLKGRAHSFHLAKSLLGFLWSLFECIGVVAVLVLKALFRV
ncbi:hypothetical protein VNO80_25985 [Phaseolus coccineus]|uniref:Uncharacterized protein n=1 Tax=Phaseolus coccineus TaxID=3886 RepID=A0AAN9QP71_PHACN